MKILHGTNNIAGIAYTLAQAQTRLGYDAHSAALSTNYAYPVEIIIPTSPHRTMRYVNRAMFASRATATYDVFHFYFNDTLLPRGKDLPLLHRLNKRIVMHYCGCELRDWRRNIQEYGLTACTHCTHKMCERMVKLDASWFDVTFVSTPDLLEFMPTAHLMPNPIDLTRWYVKPDRINEYDAYNPMRVVHAPSDRDIKGTRFVEQAIDTLQKAGLHIQLVLLENVPNVALNEILDTCDVAVDQLNAGVYGMFAVECMAKGIPTIAYMRGDLWPNMPPIIDATPATIADVLDTVYKFPGYMCKYKEAGIQYVREVHNSATIARECAKYYE